MRDPLSKKIVGMKPSGIRKFFDIVNEMDDVISLSVGEPDLTRPGISETRGFIPWKRGVLFIHPMQD